MKYQAEIHRRRSIRLKEYDYSQANAYFVTLCSQHRECLFGEIKAGIMHLNYAGLMATKWYQTLQNKFTNLQCDEFVCMPNHIHFIIQITENPTVGAHPRVRPDDEIDHPKISIPTIVQWYKTMTTNEFIRGVKENGWQPFNGRLWQRNYWERVIRNETELNQIRDYIQTNPMRWEQDKLFIDLNNNTNSSSPQSKEKHPPVYTNSNHTPVGANPRVRPVKKHGNSANQYTNATHTPVGADPRVRPDESQRQIENQGQTRGSESKGQTRGSAPTAATTATEVAQP